MLFNHTAAAIEAIDLVWQERAITLWPWKEWQGSSRDRPRDRCNVLTIANRNWGKLRKTAVRIAWVLAETSLRCPLIHKTKSATETCSGAMGICYMKAGYLSSHTYAAGRYTVYVLSICTPYPAARAVFACKHHGTGGVTGRNSNWILRRFLVHRKYADDSYACRETAV